MARKGASFLVTHQGVLVLSRLRRSSDGQRGVEVAEAGARGHMPVQDSPASLPQRLTEIVGGRQKARASCPCHHHRFGGSSATLLLNKVISSRCTMGTSRITSVRPSWSRGKMTTFNAGRSAWKLNQRQAVSGAQGHMEEKEGVGIHTIREPPDAEMSHQGLPARVPGQAVRGRQRGCHAAVWAQERRLLSCIEEWRPSKAAC